MMYIFCYAAAALIMAAAAFLYFRLPAGWLCEYDEGPSDLHLPGMRASGHSRASMIMMGILMLICIARGLYSSLGILMDQASPPVLFFTCTVLGAAFTMLGLAAVGDIEYMIISDWLVLGIGGSGLVFHLTMAVCQYGMGVVGIGQGLMEGAGQALTGMLTAGGLMLASAIISALLYGSGATGIGDIKLVAACGALVGTSEKAVFLFIFLHILSGLFMLAAMALGRLEKGCFIPLAPFIAVATYLCI